MKKLQRQVKNLLEFESYLVGYCDCYWDYDKIDWLNNSIKDFFRYHNKNRILKLFDELVKNRSTLRNPSISFKFYPERYLIMDSEEMKSLTRLEGKDTWNWLMEYCSDLLSEFGLNEEDINSYFKVLYSPDIHVWL